MQNENCVSIFHIPFNPVVSPSPINNSRGLIFTNKMELDSKNIKRLVSILLYRIQKNRRILSTRFIAFVYLFGAFCYMALFFSYNVRVAVKPLSYFVILLIMSAAYLLYVAFNHLLVRLVISHRILLIYDFLALIMLVSIIISDVWAENRYL